MIKLVVLLKVDLRKIATKKNECIYRTFIKAESDQGSI